MNKTTAFLLTLAIPILTMGAGCVKQESKSQASNDTVLINRYSRVNNSTEEFQVTIATKEIKSVTNPMSDLKTYSGLPSETTNGKTNVGMEMLILSQDQTKALVTFSTRDATKELNEFDGSLPLLSVAEFICESATKKCSETDILAAAYKAAGVSGDWFQNRILWWTKWDSVKNTLYGHLNGEGIGSASPVYIFNINNNSLQQTIGYNSMDKKAKKANVPAGYLSPSLNKFVMTEEDGNVLNVLLYNSTDLTAPLKKYDVSVAYNDKSAGAGTIHAVAWSVDEKMLVLETQEKIFTLDLDNDEVSLKYTDVTKEKGYLKLDSYGVDLSASGRYITFVEYGQKMAGDKSLKAIDLNNNNTVIELLREEGLSLHKEF